MARPVRKAKCLDCGARRTVTLHELSLAANPHCLECGGPIELLPATQRDLVILQDAMRLGRKVGRKAAVLA